MTVKLQKASPKKADKTEVLDEGTLTNKLQQLREDARRYAEAHADTDQTRREAILAWVGELDMVERHWLACVGAAGVDPAREALAAVRRSGVKLPRAESPVKATSGEASSLEPGTNGGKPQLPVEGLAENESDEAVQIYMAGMLARLAASRNKATEPALTADGADSAACLEDTDARKGRLLSLDELAPRGKPVGASADMGALRQVAIQNAFVAVGTHSRAQLLRRARSHSGLAAGFLVAGLILVICRHPDSTWLFGLIVPLLGAGGVLSLMTADLVRRAIKALR